MHVPNHSCVHLRRGAFQARTSPGYEMTRNISFSPLDGLPVSHRVTSWVG